MYKSRHSGVIIMFINKAARRISVKAQSDRECPQRIQCCTQDTAQHRTIPHNLADICDTCVSAERTQICPQMSESM